MHAEHASPLRASVVIATYASGPELDRLVASLDAQTLPTDEWEAIFVDDGSPDDTFQRLIEFARTRPHFRIERIENSGWPCRPRNTGLELAQGEYVGFMDHDDELYPDALRAGTAFAREHHADVLNGKEARTDDASWGLSTYDADRAQVLGAGQPIGALVPMNPHKLYRREFLLAHDIRFREGGRVLWEDVFFNLRVLAHAEVVSTMAHTPYYHWNKTAGSGSTTFRRSKPEWWHWFGEMLDAIAEDLAGDRLTHEREVLRGNQYRSRLLDAFGNAYPRRAAGARRLIFEQARRLQAEHFDAEDDLHLDVSNRLRAHLLRLSHPHAMHLLVEEDPRPDPSAGLRSADWIDGGLHVEFDADWRTRFGPLRMRRENDRLLKRLSAPFHRLFDDDMLDMTEDVRDASATLGVRSQDTRIAWTVDSTSTVKESDYTTANGDELVGFSVAAAGTIRPDSAAFGQSLAAGVWDVFVDCSFGGTHRQARLTADISPSSIHTPTGVCSFYADASGNAVLDIDQSGEPLSSFVEPAGAVRRSGSELLIEVTAVDGLDGDDEILTAVRLGAANGAALRAIRAAVRLGTDHAGEQGWTTEQAVLRTRGRRSWLVISATPKVAQPFTIRLGSRLRSGGGLYRVSGDVLKRVARPRR